MKTVLITGSNKGIGLATAQYFLERGWRVIGTYRQFPPVISSTEFIPIKLDLTQQGSVTEAVDAIHEVADSIDVLINNSGVLNDVENEVPDLLKIRQTFEVNVFGTIDFTERLIPNIRDDGQILNVSSVYGSFARPIDDGTTLGYRMSKAALNMYTRSLAFRLKNRSIVVSSLHPGWVKTDMGQTVATDDSRPNREPVEAAEDIYKLVTTNIETGCFWYMGKKIEW